MIGWLGSIALAFCACPQALRAYRDGHAKGLDPTFLILWTLGELFTLLAVLKDASFAYLVFNYSANLVFLLVIWRYKLFPKKVDFSKNTLYYLNRRS